VFDWYRHAIIASGKQPLALMFVAFVVTFLFIRFSVRMIRAGVRWWPGNVTPGGLHLHHVVFGVVFMVIAGAGAFSTIGDRHPWAEVFPVVFGCGAALVLDEFALILHLKDVYWTERGRTSVDAVFLAAALLGLLLLGVAPFGVEDVSAGPDVPAQGWDYAIALLINGGPVAVSLFKGKVWTGLLGILVPLFALVGALRLARPGSPWARWRYRPESRKWRRSQAREARQHVRWVRIRRRVQDALAGRPSPRTDQDGAAGG
jgi:hypothetical protein